MPALLGIDQGTTGTKAIVFDEDLRPLARAYRRVGRAQPQPGWVEQDPRELVASVAATVTEALHTAGDPVLTGAGLANQGETVVAWDAATGEPLAPALVWQDSRTQPIVDRLRAAGVEDEVRSLSGLPLDPYFSSTKLTWLLENDPAVARARHAGLLRLGTSDAYLRAALGGEHTTDPATASRTQLMNLRTLDWDARLLEIFAVPREALPAIRGNAAELGSLSHPELSAPVPLRAAIVDQQAALAGHGCTHPSQTKCTYGTGCFLLAHAGEAPPPPGALLPTVAWAIGDRVDYALEGGVLSAGSCVDWLVSLGLASDAKALDRLAASTHEDGGVRFLPAFAGLGAPWWDSDARGVLAGLTEAASAAHIARAVLYGIACSVRDLVEAVAAQGPPPSALRVDGGLAAGEALMAYQAELLAIPIERASAADTTTLGVAALAAVGCGLLEDVDAIAGLLPPCQRVEPPAGRGGADDRYREWRRFVQSAREL